MRLARLSFAAATLIVLAACSHDATGPEVPLAGPDQAKPGSITPAGPRLNGGYFGSGTRAGTDSIAVTLTAGTMSAP